jgi:hypothetical protein
MKMLEYVATGQREVKHNGELYALLQSCSVIIFTAESRKEDLVIFMVSMILNSGNSAVESLMQNDVLCYIGWFLQEPTFRRNLSSSG